MDPSPSPARRHVRAATEFQLHELVAAGGLRAQLLPTGALFALRHGPTLINQLLPGPAENGLFRLLLRWRGRDAPGGCAPLVGPEVSFEADARAARWTARPWPGLHGDTRLEFHPELAAWRWCVTVYNNTAAPLTFDVLHAQDLGLADEGAVRNNEAYVSQYVDLLPAEDAAFGWTILARQNQPMAEGRHPWLAFACATGADSFCTDGFQFFGADHRLTNEPAAVHAPALPSRRLQYEFALAGLQSRPLELAPGTSGTIVFIARFLADHPAASTPEDVARLRELFPGTGASFVSAPPTASRTPEAPSPPTASPSLFTAARWLHGDEPTDADWSSWFPGSRRHEEFAAGGQLIGFFQGASTHVVARGKEATIARPHGHILRSGESRWFDAGHFGLTCYASGIFAAQAYLGHPSFARLLSVMRNPLNVTRGSGQRVFVRRSGAWRQLGVPSAFAMTPGDARWIYRLGADVFEARVRCAREQAAACLELNVTAGAPCEFLITHELALGAAEFEHGAELELHADQGWLACLPSAFSLVGRHQAGLCFAIAAGEPAQLAALGGDEMLYAPAPAVSGGAAPANTGPYAVLRTKPTAACSVSLVGTREGPAALPAAVTAARQQL
ncbi:MAG TPA: hypothetical protein VHE13_03925, partial [Opitutus sp.]|nr:hypothetical protein [Opitutus sp.]